MVIEGTLALTGQYYITDFCEQHDVLPGFVEGFRNISRDEHRHVAYGTWYLKEKCQDPAIAERVQDKLVELHKTLFLENNPGGVKYAASKLGLCRNEFRLPVVPISESNERAIDGALSFAGLLPN